MNEIITYGGYFTGVAGAISLIISSVKTNSSSVQAEAIQAWKEQAEAHKSRADTLVNEVEEIKERLANLESYNATLVQIVSTIDPERLEQLRIRRGL